MDWFRLACMLPYVGGRHGCVVVAGPIEVSLLYFQEVSGIKVFLNPSSEVSW